jgi:hypothetical protein
VKTNYPVIANRTRSEDRVVDQTLCLTNGISKRYRIYTSDDGGYTESPNDIVPVEFDMASDLSLAAFLIESFWRLHISSVAIETFLEEYRGKSA